MKKMIKLYYEDSYIKDFTAEVKKCIPRENGYAVLLSKTAFFPTAGGQECDSGTLDGQAVLSVFTQNDEVYHIVENPIEIGKTVSGKLDFDGRFRKMQHHSAEHIVSGLAFSEFGLNNVGFHLDGSGVTVDYDAEIGEKELSKLELLANEAVWKNLPITASYPTEEELEKISYRSKIDILGKIRIIEIEGIDICACCVPHLKRTGEIGVIKFTDMIRHRGGVRIRMICGKDALSDYSEKQTSVSAISTMLSVPQVDAEKAVIKLKNDFDSLKREWAEEIKKLAIIQAENIPQTDGNYYVFADITDKNALRILANEGKNRVGGIFAVFSGNDKDGYSYILAAKSGLKDFVKMLNSDLLGKGGGSDIMAEGHVLSAKERIETVLKSYKF
ncbi:MAG: hypothetical protein IJR79_02780 [Clostridia bacterium]|nr:hypothetical protein [Clostridia bacterium]MBQ7751878.1 hypothetical protein [Clostridia bacterium]